MLRRVAIIAGFGGVVLAGGCADIMSQSAITQIAPEWFEAKKVEVKGEGYPSLYDIPQARQLNGSQADWEKIAEALKAKAAQLDAKLEADGPIRSDEDVRATAAQWRALVEGEKAKAAETAPKAPESSGP